MRKILLAVGDTAASVQTARQVRPWLKERGTALTLISVVPFGPLSPLSPFKRALEQTEAVFIHAEEQPGIILRVGSDPAAELCHEMSQGQYHLLALGLPGHSRPEDRTGSTCRALLSACPTSMLIAPSNLQVGLTPQIMILAGHIHPASGMMGWLIDQCHAQQLNVVLLAHTADDARPLHQELDTAGIRSQVIVRSDLDAATIQAQAQDRRVRWIVLPLPDHTSDAPLLQVSELLSRANCPILLARGAGRPEQTAPSPTGC